MEGPKPVDGSKLMDETNLMDGSSMIDESNLVDGLVKPGGWPNLMVYQTHWMA
jgi:hypothetical protein